MNLIDSFHCADASKFISVLLLSLLMMRHLVGWCCVPTFPAQQAFIMSPLMSHGPFASTSTLESQELPHLNVLSKIDLIEQFGETDFNLDFYTDVLDLECLLGRLSKVGSAKRLASAHSRRGAGHNRFRTSVCVSVSCVVWL